MTDFLIKMGNVDVDKQRVDVKHIGERVPCENAGRDWTNASASQRLQGFLAATRSKEERNGFYLEGGLSADKLIRDSNLQNHEMRNLCCFKLPS